LWLPGFVESPIHVLMGAASTSGLNITITDSLADIQRKLKNYAKAYPNRPVIFGSAYNGLLFSESETKREWLDAVSSDRSTATTIGRRSRWIRAGRSSSKSERNPRARELNDL